MLLAVDIGNTNTVMGLFRRGEGEDTLKANWHISTHKKETADDIGIKVMGLFHSVGVGKEEITGVAISSVVPSLNHPYQKMAKGLFGMKPMMVDHKLDLGISVKTDYPEEVGADRLVNAAACYLLYGGSRIIVDFGTATTFCVISERGEYLGGAIALGIAASAEALFTYASKLPRIDIARPPAVIGKNTVNAIQSGLVYGYASMVEGIVAKMKKEMGADMKVMATGGLSSLIAGVCDCIDKVEPYLTLKGLSVIYRKNSSV